MSQRASRVVCLVTAVLLVIAWLLTGLPWRALLGPLLLWPYVIAVMFLGLAVACALHRRPAPSLPLGGWKLRGWPLVLVFGFVVVATIARENGNWSASLSSLHTSSHTQRNTTSVGGTKDEPRLARYPVERTVQCTGGNRACEALVGVVNRRETGGSDAPPVKVRIDAQVDTPRCFLPLYKSGKYRATARVDLSHPLRTSRSSIEINIDGEATKFGFSSCRDYLGDIGESVARSIVDEVNDFLARN